MAKHSRIFATVAAAIMVAALGAGCSSSSSKSSPTTTTRKEAGFEINTPDGNASISLNGNVPLFWPDDFPVPADADVAGSGSISGANSSAKVAVYSVPGDASDTYDFYKNNTAFHVTSSSSAGLGSAFVGSVQFDGAFTGSVTLAGRNSHTYLAIVLKSTTDVTTTTVPEETTTTGIAAS